MVRENVLIPVIGARSDPSQALLDACEWTTSYVTQSWSMSPQYLTPKFVRQVLLPFYACAPLLPETSLYRLTTDLPKDTVVGSRLQLKLRMNKVVSWTLASSKKAQETIADEIGLDDPWVVRAEDKLTLLSSPRWLVEVQKKVKALRLNNPVAHEFLELHPNWQAECIALPGIVTVTVLRRLTL